MKKLLICPTFMLLFFMTSCSSLKTAPETVTEITKKIESKNFTVEVNYANPLRMKQVYLTYGYDLRIKNDSAFAYLPYYGVAHIAPYDCSEGGIKFAEPMTNYSVTPNKKSTGWDISFKVKSKLSVFDVVMNVFNNGSTMLTINSYERDMISFNGDIKR
jgi:hypothetical protein